MLISLPDLTPQRFQMKLVMFLGANCVVHMLRARLNQFHFA